jgi:PII-like signaling protein
MERLEGEHTRLRIYIGDGDQWQGQPLYRAIVAALRREEIMGATVLRGVMGYGAKSVLHSASLLRLSESLPLVVEAVDTHDNINRVLPLLDDMIAEGLVTLERVAVLRYAPRG